MRRLPALLATGALRWGGYVALWMLSAGFQPHALYLVAHVSPLNKLPLFLLGMMMGSRALLHAAAPARAAHARAWARVTTALTLFLAAYTLGQITSVMVFGAGAGFESRIVGELALPIVYLLWMYGLTQSPDGLSARTFRLAPFRLLGRISFCVYVLHFPLLHYYAWLRAAAAGRSYWGAARRQEPYDVLGAFALVLGVSTLAYYGIEEPVRRRLQRLLAPRGRTAHAAARAADPELLPADSCAQQAHAADEAGVAMHAVVMVEATPVPGDGGAPAQLGAGARSEPGI